MFKEFKEKVYKFINESIYSDKRVDYFLDCGTWSHINPENDGIKVNYEIIDHFEKEELEKIESQEKDSTKEEILGITGVWTENEVYIIYSRDVIKDYVFSMNPLIVWSEIMDIAKHEAYHAQQYIWILKNKGLEGVKKIKEYMANTPYEDNIIEIGAYAYQIYDNKQDFEKDFAPILNA